MLTVWAYRLAIFIVPFLPRRFGCLCFGLVGSLAYYLAPGKRRVVESNVTRVLGPYASPTKVRRTARAVFRNAAKNYFDLFRLPRFDIRKFDSIVQVPGLEHFLKARDAGKGIIVVSAHLGNFDVCGQVIAAHTLDVAILAEPIQPPELLDLVVKLRGSNGVRFVPVGTSTLREVIKVLRQGGAVGIGSDRDIQKSGLKMPFFGAEASMPQGAAQLALKTGAALVPAFGQRLPDDTFVIHVEPPLEVSRTGDFDVDVRLVMTKIASVLEKYIGAMPDQWVVFERIWPDPM